MASRFVAGQSGEGVMTDRWGRPQGSSLPLMVGEVAQYGKRANWPLWGLLAALVGVLVLVAWVIR